MSENCVAFNKAYTNFVLPFNMLTFYRIFSFVDAIIHQHMFSLKSRVFNFDWVNKHFAESLRIYDDDVNSCRKLDY